MERLVRIGTEEHDRAGVAGRGGENFDARARGEGNGLTAAGGNAPQVAAIDIVLVRGIDHFTGI